MHKKQAYKNIYWNLNEFFNAANYAAFKSDFLSGNERIIKNMIYIMMPPTQYKVKNSCVAA